ncbi:hypothetical protein KUF71_004139 [Frankliniella fusca]|uniref:Uncharacterized protein n=1 Tax=Frankliniella fusca TaxID=407009 RepID=A0AAE1L8J5_9NEOP|nr:hypothetical protein KUF71_004139 [Frankliniella fusca]
MAFMHSAAVEALPTELSLWLSSATQIGEERSQWIMVSPLANFDSATTIELEVAVVGYAYADPAHMLLYTKEKIVNADGSDITDADNSDATLVNYGMHAQWSQVDASINGTVISQSSMTYPWRAYVEAFLNYDKAAKDTHLQQRMWHEDTPGHHDSLDSNQNLGLAWRRSRTKLSREFEMMGPLHLDICNTDRLLLNNCTLRLKLTRSRDAFALMCTKGTEKIKLLDVKLFIRRVTISPSVLLAHAQALEKSPAKYRVNRVDIKTVTIAQGMHSKTIDNLFLNQLPQRVIIGFVDNRAFNGDYARNPFRQKDKAKIMEAIVDDPDDPSDGTPVVLSGASVEVPHAVKKTRPPPQPSLCPICQEVLPSQTRLKTHTMRHKINDVNSQEVFNYEELSLETKAHDALKEMLQEPGAEKQEYVKKIIDSSQNMSEE